MTLTCRAAAVAVATVLSFAGAARAQNADPDLARLLTDARAVNPSLRAADETIAAARARAAAAGLLPDPRVGVGIVNALVSDPLSSDDFMTMRMVEVGQVVPFPGKRGLEREAARWEVATAEAERRAVELDVVEAVQREWYELAFLDRAIEVVQRNRALLGDLADLSDARYAVGLEALPQTLEARVEGTRLGEEWLGLAERRSAAGARLNAVLDRPSTTPIGSPGFPDRVERHAIPEPGTEVRFTTAALDPTGGDRGTIPDLATLQRMARDHNPHLRAHVARIAAARAAARLAGRAALPDFDLSAGYGQRGGREDMVSFRVSVPIPLFAARKQDALAAAERAGVASLEAEHRAIVADLDAEVAVLHTALIRTRERIALTREGILPQARAALEAAIAGYPVAIVDFRTLLDDQARVFRHELEEVRLLADFGRDLAALERIVGTEVLP